jgi:polyketide cyclase/dehydrase/lipid transport protein
MVRASTTTSSAPIVARVRIFIAREPQAVFDYLADLRNEPQYNSDVSAIRKISPGKIGHGSTFEGLHRGLGRVTWKLAEYERPTHVAIAGRVGRGTYRWESDFRAANGGTWMIGRMEWEPPPRWRPFGFLLGPILRWNARRSFGRMADLLQAKTRPT